MSIAAPGAPPVPAAAAWVRTAGLGAVLYVVVGIVVGAAVGTPGWPVVGTVAGAAAGLALGAASGLLVGGVLGLPVLRGSRTLARAVGAVLAAAASGCVLLLLDAAVRPPLALGVLVLAALWGGWSAPALTSVPSAALVRRGLACLGAGLATGLAVGAVVGLVLGLRYPPTAAVAVVEGAFLGSVCGVALGSLALLVGVVPAAVRPSRRPAASPRAGRR